MLQALWGLFSALLVTVAVEAAVGWVMGLRTWRSQAILLLINCITNPLLNLAFAALAHWGVYSVVSAFAAPVLIAECVVVIVEAVLFHISLGKSAGKALALSAVLNLSSWLAGALLFR